MSRLKQIMLIGTPVLWFYVGTHDKETVKRNMFNRGLTLSQYFKPYPIWDSLIEPFIVRRSGILFAGCNSFIKGMISDNKNTKDISDSVAIYKEEIEQELKDM